MKAARGRQIGAWTFDHRAVAALLLAPFSALLVAQGGCGGVALDQRGSGGSPRVGDSSSAHAGGGASGAGNQVDASCKLFPEACSSSSECCAGHCWGGLCQRPGCLLPGGRCGTSDDCCLPAGSGGCLDGYCVASGLGVPDPPAGACRGAALPCGYWTDGGGNDGAGNSECCSGYCFDGLCQPAACARQGAPCATGCCSLTQRSVVCGFDGLCTTRSLGP
jgi:hypothetical protein